MKQNKFERPRYTQLLVDLFSDDFKDWGNTYNKQPSVAQHHSSPIASHQSQIINSLNELTGLELNPSVEYVSKIASAVTNHNLQSNVSNSLNYSYVYEQVFEENMNCSSLVQRAYAELRNEYYDIISLIHIIHYVIIFVGILFNILNLLVLLKSKLHESPYTYLTMLALSDLGALIMFVLERIRQLFLTTNSEFVENIHLYVIVLLVNVFLSSSMYVTLALTIERFIFVHSPFKAMSICRRSIARRVCLGIFIFSFVRLLYLPFMYKKNCLSGHDQHKFDFIDFYEFVVSLALPYTIIFIANISLIFSLNRQNNLMSASVSTPSLASGSNAQKRSKTGSTLSLSSLNPFRIKRDGTKRSQASISQSVASTSPNPGHREPVESTRLIKPGETSDPATSGTSAVATTGTPAIQITMPSPPLSPTPAPLLATKSTCMYHRTSNLRELRNQKKLTITLIIILCLLLVCYLPSFLFEESLADAIFGSHEVDAMVVENGQASRVSDNITLEKIEKSKKAFKIKAIGTRISTVLIYFNCSMNFLIYCICNKKFKNSLKTLIRKSWLNVYYQRVAYFLSKHCCSYLFKSHQAARRRRQDESDQMLDRVVVGYSVNRSEGARSAVSNGGQHRAVFFKLNSRDDPAGYLDQPIRSKKPIGPSCITNGSIKSNTTATFSSASGGAPNGTESSGPFGFLRRAHKQQGSINTLNSGRLSQEAPTN